MSGAPAPSRPTDEQLRETRERLDRAGAARNGSGPDGGEASVVPRAADPAAPASSWTPVDLGPTLNGTHVVEEPSILRRTDGRAIFYAGRLHGLAGEPEACKGWLTMHAAAEQLRAGHRVVLVDFEGEVVEAVERLQALGVKADLIRGTFRYVRPDEPMTDAAWEAFAPVIAERPRLVIVDGVTAGMTLNGLNPLDNVDVARWQRVWRRLIGETGAAVVEVDHVVKDRESRGRYSLGAQHKLAGVDVALMLNLREPFGRGRTGEADVLVKKDRPGFIRAYADDGKVATVRLVSDGEFAVEIGVEPPAKSAAGGAFRPTTLMERITEALELEPGMSVTKVREAVEGNSRAKDTALRILVAEDYVRVEQDGQARRHYTVRLYRAGEDPKVADDA